MSMANNLTEIWNLYNTRVLNEKAPAKKAAKMNTKEGPGPKNLNDKDAGAVDRKDSTGPNAVDNFNGPAFNRNISDLKTMSDKDKQDKPYVKKLNVTEENFDKTMEKSTKAAINNNMKSTFDKLFEDVMNSEDDKDLQALGVDTETAEGDLEGGEGDVTVTLSPEHVDALKAILAQIEGGAEGEDLGDDDAMGDAGMGEEGMPDDGMGSEEDAEEKKDDDEKKEKVTEATGKVDSVVDGKGKELASTVSKMTGKGNIKVGDKTAKMVNGKAGTTTVSDEVDGKGKDVPDSAGLALTKMGNNKPASKIKGGNQEAYGIK